MYHTRKRIGSMLCYPFEEKRLQGGWRNAWNQWPVIVQPKLDGERCRYKNGLLLSSTEDIIYSVPHIQEELKRLNCPYELDGELYCHGMEFEDIHSIVSRTVNLHQKHEDIEFHVFDIATDEKDTQVERITKLCNWFGTIESEIIGRVFTTVVNDLEELIKQYDSFCSSGYEGIIIRHPHAPYIRRRSTNVMKFKPKQKDDYKIIDVKEEHTINGEPKNQLGNFVVGSDTGDIFDVYSGLSDFTRKQLWELVRTHGKDAVIGKTLTVHYQHKNKNGVPKFGRVKDTEIKSIWSLT